MVMTMASDQTPYILCVVPTENLGQTDRQTNTTKKSVKQLNLDLPCIECLDEYEESDTSNVRYKVRRDENSLELRERNANLSGDKKTMKVSCGLWDRELGVKRKITRDIN